MEWKVTGQEVRPTYGAPPAPSRPAQVRPQPGPARPTPEPPPAIRWEDEVLAQSARRLPRHTLSREGEGFSLSFPFDQRAPFPLTPAFCFARVENGRLIFSFRRGGLPYIFPGEGKARGEVEDQRGEHHGKPDHQGAQRPGGPAGL